MRTATIFLQLIVILTGIAAVAILLWEPHLEGRNIHATAFDIYFKDPFLAYVYVASIPFFAALYQSFNLLGYARGNRIFSQRAVKALHMIKYCALAIIAFALLGDVFILLNTGEDRAGGIFISLLIMLGATIAVAAAVVADGVLRRGVNNDDTA